MSIPIKIAKTIWNHDEKKLFVIGKFKKTINFGEMQTVWLWIFLLVISALSVRALNNTNPKLLHEYPNNLIIYSVHVLCPFLWIASLAIWFFTKNSELKKAGKILVKNIFEDKFSLVLLQWSLYKKSRKYADQGIELSSFQKAIVR